MSIAPSPSKSLATAELIPLFAEGTTMCFFHCSASTLAATSSKQSELKYENVFRVLIVQFIDAYDFDLRSIRKTCVHIVHPDGQRVIPFDTYNLFYRDELEETVLNPIRQERISTTFTQPVYETE